MAAYSDLEQNQLMMMVACLCHDANHDGSTNGIHRKDLNSKLVAKYGPDSPLEHMHADECDRLVRESKLLSPLLDTDEDEFLEDCRRFAFQSFILKRSFSVHWNSICINISRGVGWEVTFFVGIFLCFFSFLGSINVSRQSKYCVILATTWRFEVGTACRRQASFRSVNFFSRSESRLVTVCTPEKTDDLIFIGLVRIEILPQD
jgi:hypothetical protein